MGSKKHIHINTGDTVPVKLYTDLQMECRRLSAVVNNLSAEKKELNEIIQQLQDDIDQQGMTITEEVLNVS